MRYISIAQTTVPDVRLKYANIVTYEISATPAAPGHGMYDSTASMSVHQMNTAEYVAQSKCPLLNIHTTHAGIINLTTMFKNDDSSIVNITKMFDIK